MGLTNLRRSLGGAEPQVAGLLSDAPITETADLPGLLLAPR